MCKIVRCTEDWQTFKAGKTYPVIDKCHDGTLIAEDADGEWWNIPSDKFKKEA